MICVLFGKINLAQFAPVQFNVGKITTREDLKHTCIESGLDIFTKLVTLIKKNPVVKSVQVDACSIFVVEVLGSL